MRCLKCGSELPDEAYFCAKCGAKVKNKTSDKVFLPTPHGGVMSEMFYFNSEHKPCTKDKAQFMEVVEFNESGEKVYSFTAKRKSAE